MKKIISLILALTIGNIALSGQSAQGDFEKQLPDSVKYYLPEFMEGRIIYKDGGFSTGRFNISTLDQTIRYMDSDEKVMGTTLVSAVAGERDAVICNIGDSRAYLIHNGEMMRITHDHSVVQTLVENGDITAEEARTHPNRNLITRALGPDETTLCDAFDVSFAHGDKILLCTDGLVVTATDEEICRIVCADKRAEEKLDDLIALAKAQGAPDNVTAVLIEHE